MDKIKTIEQVMEHIKDGMTIMTGGFLGAGSPDTLIDAILAKGVKNITLIANDTAFVDRGIGKLIVSHQISKAIVSHVGTNKETGNRMNDGSLEVILTPQGTLAEQVRQGGAGLGGFLTPTGLGTAVAEGKQVINIDGKDYLLEKTIRADIALVKASIADKSGNLYYKKATRNFNPLIATAADLVIVEAEEIVEVGAIDQTDVMTPGVLVDMIVQGV